MNNKRPFFSVIIPCELPACNSNSAKCEKSYVSSVYWQDFFQQKASGTDGVAKARKWRQVQQSSARGFAPAALSCHLEIVVGTAKHVTTQLTQIGACILGQGEGGLFSKYTISFFQSENLQYKFSFYEL